MEKQHSDTAMMAAGYRAVACKEFPGSRLGSDNLAENFIRPLHKIIIRLKAIRNLALLRDRKFTPGGFEYVVARTVFFDKVYLDAIKGGVKQIIMLGAGYDTRAFRFADRCTDCRIIELDIATTQNRKKKLLKKAGIVSPAHLKFSSIDFNLNSLSEVLLQAGYNSEEKTLFLWEGVSMYLESEAVDATLQLVSSCRNKDSLLVFDYIASISEGDIDEYYGVKTWRETWRKYRKDEPFKFTMDETQLSSYLDKRGLLIQSHLASTEIEEQCLLTAINNNPGHITGWFRFVTATPNQR